MLLLHMCEALGWCSTSQVALQVALQIATRCPHNIAFEYKESL